MKFAQRETMHMIGEGFSVMQFDVLADGQPTRIIRSVSTDGRPNFKKTSDTFSCDGDSFDCMSPERGNLQAWLEHSASQGEMQQEPADIPMEPR